MSNQSVNSRELKLRDQAVKISKIPQLALGARTVFKVMAWIFAICIFIQVFFAGLALFWNSAQWANHTAFARFLSIVPIIMLIVSFIARLPLSLRLRSASLIGIIIVMAVSANLPSGIGYVSALHPVIAIVLLGETVSIARKTGSLTEKHVS